jgi:phosphatidylglycerophosphatase A
MTSKTTETHEPPATAAYRNWTVFLATGTWLGRSPVAPGTVGAIWGIPLAWGIGLLPSVWMQACAIGAICAAGVPLCTAAVRRLGGAKDPGCVVFDEIASLPITFFLVPMHHWGVVCAGFLLHRLFDITKPPPARQLEGLPDGLGVMADDWAAGVYSNLAVQLLVWLNPWGISGG